MCLLPEHDDRPVDEADVHALYLQLLEDRQCLLAALSKISRKIAEPDPRTKLKALHLLHLSVACRLLRCHGFSLACADAFALAMWRRLIRKMQGDDLEVLHQSFEVRASEHSCCRSDCRASTLEKTPTIHFLTHVYAWLSLLLLFCWGSSVAPADNGPQDRPAALRH